MTRFRIPGDVAEQYPRRIVGMKLHEELWVPAEELTSFCASFLGEIEVVRGWLGPGFRGVADWSGGVGELNDDELIAVVAHIATESLRGGPATAGEHE